MRYPKHNRGLEKSRSGFTLVELMVTLVILTLLSTVVAVSVRSYLTRSKQNVAKIEIGKLVQALDTFYATYDRYPTNDEGITILAAKTDEFPDGLISFVPDDPWGNPYEYRCPGIEEPFDLICLGADKREGGSGADKDIASSTLKNN